MVELIKVIVACKQWVKERTFTVIYMYTSLLKWKWVIVIKSVKTKIWIDCPKVIVWLVSYMNHLLLSFLEHWNKTCRLFINCKLFFGELALRYNWFYPRILMKRIETHRALSLCLVLKIFKFKQLMI